MRTPIKKTQYTTEPIDCLVADPPWQFSDKLPGEKRGASKHYGTINIDDLKTFPIPHMKQDSILFMWRVASMQYEALELCEAWGFTPKTELVWFKETKNGLIHFGMGRYVRASHETCIIATRGSYKVDNRSVRSVFNAPVGVHSEKPDKFFEIVQALTGPNAVRVELFARKRRQGFHCYGNEL